MAERPGRHCPLEPLPAHLGEVTMDTEQQTGTMTVRIRARAAEPEWGSGLTSPAIRTVTISDRCPVCGGPRGEARNLNQCDDGAYYSVDVWTNACGHVDSYEAVYREARIFAAPQPDEALRRARVVQLAAAALGAYEAYVKALADNATRADLRRAHHAFLAADEAVNVLRERRGYEYGDHVRLNSPGPFHGLTGTLRATSMPGDYRYPVTFVFDQPQSPPPPPHEHGGEDGLVRSVVAGIGQIADIEP